MLPQILFGPTDAYGLWIKVWDGNAVYQSRICEIKTCIYYKKTQNMFHISLVYFKQDIVTNCFWDKSTDGNHKKTSNLNVRSKAHNHF